VCCLAPAGCSGSHPAKPDALAPAVLQTGDFPASWRHAPNALRPADADLLGRLADCTGVIGGAVHPPTAELRSDVFTDGALRIFSTATSYPGQYDVDRRIATLALPKADGCLPAVLAPVVRSAVPGGHVVTSRFTALAGAINAPANEGGSAYGSAVVEADGRRHRVHVDAVFLTGADIATVLVFVGVDRRVPAAVRDPLARVVATRALSL
jgi:hypothetical protein